MARPREFEESQVLEAALQVFWVKGYDATSIDDLVTATRVGRASLYATFGDKERLFARVLEFYLAKAAELDDIPAAKSPAQALRDMTSLWVRSVCPRSGPRGCFLSLSGTSGTSAAFVRKTVASVRNRRKKKLVGLIAAGQQVGDIERAVDPRTVANVLLVVQQGIATSARAGVPLRELEQVMSQVLASLLVSVPTEAPLPRTALVTPRA
jgi:AcrR family transcriptional regulator